MPEREAMVHGNATGNRTSIPCRRKWGPIEGKGSKQGATKGEGWGWLAWCEITASDSDATGRKWSKQAEGRRLWEWEVMLKSLRHVGLRDKLTWAWGCLERREGKWRLLRKEGLWVGGLGGSSGEGWYGEGIWWWRCWCGGEGGSVWGYGAAEWDRFGC